MIILRECPFCGERLRLRVVCKWMRRPDYRDNVPAAYVRCLSCNARGPIASGDAESVQDHASVMWNGLCSSPCAEKDLPLFNQGDSK